MTDIKWGPAIPVDGKRPDWLVGPFQYTASSGVTRWYGPVVGYSGWDHVEAIRLPADHPHYRQTEAAPIDWGGELEAVHEDGRVVPVDRRDTTKRTDNDWYVTMLGRNWIVTNDGEVFGSPWRIRNVPQPAPQADTKPDLTARAPCMTISEVREMVAKGEDAVIATMLERGYALPEPVDEDLIEARKLAHELAGDRFGWDGMLEGKHDGSPAIRQLLAAIKRGRALALAGEKEA